MLILPAIDLKQGHCVRLSQGEIETAMIYDDDPVKVALSFATAGAQMIHVVDLDGAFGVHSPNRKVLVEILATVDVPVEFGGGLRSVADVEDVLELGVARVVLGTLAHESPDELARLVAISGERICVGIDAFAGKVRTRGWQTDTSESALDFARAVAAMGVQRIVYTDIGRDGMLTGPAIEQTCEIARAANVFVTASGGISSLADIRSLNSAKELLVDSVIIGKAIYERKFTLEEAIAAAGEQTS